MVLIAATVCTKSGKALVSRQFVEMTKARIEGLLTAFPKLMTGGRQHTFVETESVRYVYQPLDKLYMLLITTKASNILEDLETLRLFSRVVPEYCTQLTEAEVLNQAFNLLFAFDEIVALGYRESVNLAQVRSFVEMDSHEEKIYQAVRQTQEREAANRMRERAKELQRERLEAAKRGLPTRSSSGFGSGFSSSTISSSAVTEPITEKIPTTPVRDTSGNPSVVVHQWEGSYTQKGRSIIWSIPVINGQQKSGTLEFTVTPAIPNDFFPLSVTWTSDTSLALIAATKVTQAEDGSSADYSQDVSFHADNLKISHASLIYQDHHLKPKAFVLPTKETKQMYDDIGFIVVHDEFPGKWKTVELFDGKRTDGVFRWFGNLVFDDFEHKVVGYAKFKTDESVLVWKRPYYLTQLKVHVSLNLCPEILIYNQRMDGFAVPCYHSCTLAQFEGKTSKRHPRCNNYHGSEGSAIINLKTNKLLGIATWGAYFNKYELPVGFSVPNSDIFYEDKFCAEKIRDHSDFIVDPGFYQELCDGNSRRSLISNNMKR
ncbi:jg6795 [Pararge aegeria aegeria]|uniref:Coatomer subunit delta n=1 Tax=Pararge aegeria aegeria TaxID=348720 RepID=A0A8S4RQ51_9NEOP|nr:jg6795 [Pararge aegeria aegeria]